MNGLNNMLDETKLFDFVKIMFTRPSDYKKIKHVNKKRHHFMINRFFSIKYPMNAQAFNINGIDSGNVVECWSLVASRFKSVPGWIYTKTKRAAKNERINIFLTNLQFKYTWIVMRSEIVNLKK